MSDLHRAYLNVGSNLEPERNIPRCLELLRRATLVERVSALWETASVGYPGPNVLNLCAAVRTPLDAVGVRDQIVRPIEDQMGRVRTTNKNAPREIDLDLVLFDDVPHNAQNWEQAFWIVPLAELLPGFALANGETLADRAHRLQRTVWLRKRDDLLL